MTAIPKRGGTNDVLLDLGFSDAEELAAKTILAKKLNEVIDSRRLTESETAELLGMPQSKFWAIRNYKLRDISLRRLMRALTALGQRVEIIVSPSTKEAPPWIDVVA
jgi:predicted XRE-type DNA-binding protein